MARCILIAVDGSPHATTAFEWMLENVHRPDDAVHIVLVYDLHQVPLQWVEPTVVTSDWKAEIAKNYSEAQEKLDEYRCRLQEKGIASTIHLPQSHGNTGAAICQVGKDIRADCIVVGTRGLGAFTRTILGSTSNYILHHAECPVLVVKQKVSTSEQ